MSTGTKNKGLMWILFLVSTAAFLFACFAHWPWLTLILPFVTTFFCKGNGYHLISNNRLK